jgi:hypothetical protein
MITQWFDVGQRPLLTVTFTDGAGNVFDPPTVRFAYRPPGGTRTVLTYLSSAAVVRLSAGVYRTELPIPISLTSVGEWTVRFESLDAGGLPLAADESVFGVRWSNAA